MKIVSWLLVVTGCVLVASGLAYYKYREIQAAIAFGASFPEPVMAVEPFVARSEVWQPTVSVTGEVVAVRSIELSNELAGRIVAVGFEPGATVAADQILVRLDTSEETAQLAAARAQAALAKLALARNRRLMQSGAAAEEAQDQARAQYDAAVASVRRLQSVIDKKILRAPFAAQAGLHELEVGQYIDSGTVVTRLVGTGDRVWIDFTLPQPQAGLELGTRVSVSAAGLDTELTAPIIARDSFVDERSRSVRFRALADKRGHRLSPGALVTVNVPVGPARTATLVPAPAVRRDAFGASVYVLRPAGEESPGLDRAERRTVTVGEEREGLVVIRSGLEPGEEVAANGAFKLRDGVLVRASGQDDEGPR